MVGGGITCPPEEDQWLSCPVHLRYFSLTHTNMPLVPPFP